MTFDIFLAPFTDEAMRRALVAIVVLSFGSAPIGVFLMLRRMSLTGDAMSHAILPGVAVAFLLSGMNRLMMTLGGLIAGLIVAVLSGLMARVTEMKEDASLAVFYLVSLALGVILVASNGSSHELIEILFGDVQTIDAGALCLIAFNTTLTLCALAVIYRPLVMECVDPLFLRVAGRAGALAHLVFMAFVVVNLVSAYHALGTLLAVGMMILPAGIARFWSRDLSRIIPVAIVSAIVSGYFGLVLAAATGAPAGPSVVLMAGAIYFLSMTVGPAGGLVRRFAPGRHLEA
ncbi:MAG: metal ABC transporter permease [Xanthobacteraceae bacterium]|nr:metal ABC transporter permease [Xanthobacteraceae bacterium]